MGLRRLLKRALRATRWDVVLVEESAHAAARRVRLLRAMGIDLVLDVGANLGQFGRELRARGYAGRIVSFEPLLAAHAVLAEVAARDGNWVAERLALGASPGTATIHVTANLASSSFLDATPRLGRTAPYAAVTGTEEVPVTTLAVAIERHVRPSDRAFLKIDTQGFEKVVLESAGGRLPRIDCIQVELALQRTYRDQPDFDEMYRWFRERDYQLAVVEPGFSDPRSGIVLEVDATFVSRRWLEDLLP
ncbi:MAG TPA: FkbM family methyltransferase [Anaeromyxobacteraceae bacterium]|nr:FkbM family methyltransferase [Anaeromyxobacteraceae bacterium]